MEYKDYYKILGVERSASPEEIKKAYRKLARGCHPDACKDDPSAEKRFKELGEAYEVLKDPDKRARYDALGSSWQQGQSFTPPPGFENIFGFGGGRGGHSFNFDMGGGGFSDFFESLFGGMGGMGGMGAQPRSRRASRGSDVETELNISLEDAHCGATREISLSGAGGVKRLNVKIPAGTHEGLKIRLGGQGNPGPAGSGDLFIKLHILAGPGQKLEGDDVVVEVAVTPWDAALGASITVDTLDGQVKMKMPAGVSSGQRLRFKGKGLGHRGDLYAQVKIVTPPNLSDEERQLFTRLRAVSSFKP
ncbi:MAG: Curved DNA-binding protein [Deltaproteobacteria bacterium ADurb.Bin510]|nr:MAG: Curved DNA-binding protein [Deltaproteobacteria bacterium ADurb.Bin510]